ncbi:MAG: GGDEF domain-containing protein [Sterolibacterium sp.]|nr:GGDEF domain-containing protein [Sterolibacterium sp.]
MTNKVAEQHAAIARLLPQQPASCDESPTLAGHCLEQDQQLRVLLDTSSRTSGGIFMYLAIWLVIAWGTRLINHDPLLVWSFAAWLLLIACLRILLSRIFPALVAKRPKLARRALYTTILVNALSWGVLTAASIYSPALDPIRIAMLLVAVGICSAGSMAMAIDSFLRIWFPIALIFPIAIGALTNINDSNLLLAALTLVYTVYLMFSTHIVHRDYWRAIHITAQFERASLTDALTQVANRMSFDRQYQHEWRRASRHSNGLAVLMVDLDHFKKINDTHGHPVGDRVLQHIANTLQNSLLRGGDSVARYGGEEFVVLLPQADKEGTMTVAQRILANVSSQSITLDNGEELHITCSIGCALTLPHEQPHPEELLKQADAALYIAKNAGRNRAYFNHGEGIITPIQRPASPSHDPAAQAAVPCDESAKTA